MVTHTCVRICFREFIFSRYFPLLVMQAGMTRGMPESIMWGLAWFSGKISKTCYNWKVNSNMYIRIYKPMLNEQSCGGIYDVHLLIQRLRKFLDIYAGLCKLQSKGNKFLA
jgi:hypothetical protein